MRRDKATRISYISLNISYKFENEIEILFCKPANAYDWNSSININIENWNK